RGTGAAAGDDRATGWLVVPMVVSGVGVDASGGRGVPGAAIKAWQRDVGAIAGPFWAGRLQRERDIAAHVAAAPVPLFQPALFDRRAERAQAATAAAWLDAARESDARLAVLARQSVMGDSTGQLLLVAEPPHR